MKQLAPDLFDRRFQDLVEIGRARLPSLAPDWTDHNAHDPGITLMELLAWVAEAQLYSLARACGGTSARRMRHCSVSCAGGTEPARGLIWPDHGDPQSPGRDIHAQSVVIPADAVVNVVNDETPTFRPAGNAPVDAGAHPQARDAARRRRHDRSHRRRTNAAALPFLPFGDRAGRRDVLAMTFECRGDAGLFGARAAGCERARLGDRRARRGADRRRRGGPLHPSAKSVPFLARGDARRRRSIASR